MTTRRKCSSEVLVEIMITKPGCMRDLDKQGTSGCQVLGASYTSFLKAKNVIFHGQKKCSSLKRQNASYITHFIQQKNRNDQHRENKKASTTNSSLNSIFLLWGRKLFRRNEIYTYRLNDFQDTRFFQFPRKIFSKGLH
jgi:hypothetical protein